MILPSKATKVTPELQEKTGNPLMISGKKNRATKIRQKKISEKI